MHPDLEKLVARAKIDPKTADQLDRLQPGTFCYHKSWKAGRIASWDRLGLKVVIDFEDKPGHEMGMKFVASSIEPVEEDHFYAKRFADIDAMRQMAGDDPVSLVKLALESRGGKLSLDQLDEMIKGRVVPEGKYKGWWESTKKKLRSEPRFVVPAKRNEPLELRDADLSPAAALVQSYEGARDLKGKLKAAEAILREITVFEDPAAQLLGVVEDLADSAKKAQRLNLESSIELILARDDIQEKVPELKLDANQIGIADLLSANEASLPELLKNLSISRVRSVMGALPTAFGEEQWVSKMLGLIPICALRAISEIARYLADRGYSDALLEFIESRLQQRTLSSDALAWVCKERKGMAEVIFDPSISLAVMAALEVDSLNEEGGVRAANRLRDLLNEDKTLIHDLIAESDINTVRNFAGRLMGTAVFDDLTRNSLMARIIKIYPEVQSLVLGRRQEEEEPLIVSAESLEKRKAAYDKLIREEIPQNREDIKIARSYGDLRENFEYKSAKEYQRVLMKRKADWERELKLAQPTDFKSADGSKVTVGTVVTLEVPGTGETRVYTVLGAWDSDPDNHVVPYLSDVGQALIDKKPGDDVAMPTASGGRETLRIQAVRPWLS
ncbi:MAG: GreA/GreB family elongation factor [Verrucomicrobiales bacterium]|nr:GreA/GreB family elongation factor [Verrucomicrobiales bacterium]